MLAQIITGGVVTNVIAIDSSSTLSADEMTINGPDGQLQAPSGASFMVQPGAGIGWTLSGGVLVAPAPPVITLTAAQLIAYAQNKMQAIESGGILVNIGSPGSPQNVECATDNATFLRVMAANAIAQTNPTQTQQYPFPSGVITLTANQIEAIFQAITAFYASVTTQLADVIIAINTGAITTKGGVDTPPSPIPAWPVNS